MRFYMGMNFNGDKVAPLNAYLRDPHVKRAMISFYYYKYNSIARFIADGLFEWNRNNPDKHIDIMIDSGAFSFMADEEKMKKIDLESYIQEYGEFVTKHEQYIDRFIELDVQSIVGVEEYERFYKMLDVTTPPHRKPTIVWHVTEDLSKFDNDLKRCIDQGDNLVCIGGAAALRITGNRGLSKMMQELCYYAASKGVHIHGLGITSRVARYIDFYSVDSLSFVYDLINNREAEGAGNGRLRDNYGSYGAAVHSVLTGKLMQYYWDLY
jgi:hypothetical protein